MDDSRPNDDGVGLAITVRRYLEAREHYQAALNEFTAACNALRERAPKNDRCVVRIDWRYYLIETDAQGDFDVTEIDVL